jgi:hypothetical protein
LLHLKVPNHGKLFKALLKAYLGKYGNGEDPSSKQETGRQAQMTDGEHEMSRQKKNVPDSHDDASTTRDKDVRLRMTQCALAELMRRTGNTNIRFTAKELAAIIEQYDLQIAKDGDALIYRLLKK